MQSLDNLQFQKLWGGEVYKSANFLDNKSQLVYSFIFQIFAVALILEMARPSFVTNRDKKSNTTYTSTFKVLLISIIITILTYLFPYFLQAYTGEQHEDE